MKKTSKQTKATSSKKAGDSFLSSNAKDYSKLSFGTYGEKSLHKFLKNYIDSDESHQEIKLGRSIVDIFDGEKITEIQTGSFQSVYKKLPSLLESYKLEIVFPIFREKEVAWLNKETGEIVSKHLSPKHATICEILPHLYRIRELLENENLSFRVISLGATEYRILDGWSEDKKRGSHRLEIVANKLFSETIINSKEDYKEFLRQIGFSQKDNERGFTSKEFAKKSKLSPSKASSALIVLTKKEAVARVGKKKNAYIYNVK